MPCGRCRQQTDPARPEDGGVFVSEPDQAAASVLHSVDFTMNSSRVWQTTAAGARHCADVLISAFRA
jgi:hypothetical protein